PTWVLKAPEFLASGRIPANDRFVFVILKKRDRLAAGYREVRISDTGGGLPKLFESGVGPLGQETGFALQNLTRWPAPLGPLACLIRLLERGREIGLLELPHTFRISLKNLPIEEKVSGYHS